MKKPAEYEVILKTSIGDTTLIRSEKKKEAVEVFDIAKIILKQLGEDSFFASDEFYQAEIRRNTSIVCELSLMELNKQTLKI